MPAYTTEYIKNLTTGHPFTFEVPEATLRRLEEQKRLIAAGHAPMLGSIENFMETNEFSFFPSFEKLLEIWTTNGYTTELITQILMDFGIAESFIPKLLEDDNYVTNIKPWFEGITCDGGRAATTIKVVYNATKRYFSTTANVEKTNF